LSPLLSFKTDLKSAFTIVEADLQVGLN